MALTFLEEAIQPVYENLDSKDFSRIIREARDSLGIKLYKAAEFIGVASARLKNLETGYFRIMPTEVELKVLATLYNIDINSLKEKAQEHVQRREIAKKKVAIMHQNPETKKRERKMNHTYSISTFISSTSSAKNEQKNFCS